MKELEDFIIDVMSERNINSLGSITHGVQKEILVESSERYSKYILSEGLKLILKIISDTQYELTNDLHERTGTWVTDVETINKIDFKTILEL